VDMCGYVYVPFVWTCVGMCVYHLCGHVWVCVCTICVGMCGYVCVPFVWTCVGMCVYHLCGHVWVCVCTICLWFQCLRLCILSNANVYKLYRVSLNIRSSPKWGIIIIIIIIIIMLLTFIINVHLLYINWIHYTITGPVNDRTRTLPHTATAVSSLKNYIITS
jgi:hypothetical protein